MIKTAWFKSLRLLGLKNWPGFLSIPKELVIKSKGAWEGAFEINVCGRKWVPLLGREDIAPADNEQDLGWHFIVCLL